MKYILFGTGDYYERYKTWFEECEVIALLDNSISKQGTYIDGVPVVAPIMIKRFEYDVVVIMSFYYEEMKSQLVDIGVDKTNIYHFYDLHELFDKERSFFSKNGNVLLMMHDLSVGGPSLALFNAAKILKQKYDVSVASMINGPLIDRITEERIPVIVDRRLQVCTMNELPWTMGYDLIICNTINYHVFLADRNVSIPIIWWLHDARRYYDGIKGDNLRKINMENMKILSVGPIPGKAITEFLPNVRVDDLLYGVSENE